MENVLTLGMEKIAEPLQRILSTQLLAPSIGELAECLGYKGRSSLYRILNGTATERAVSSLCRKLNDVLSVDEDSLLVMDATVQNASHLGRTVRKYIDLRAEDAVRSVVRSFVADDFSIFPEEFVTNDLDEFLNFERNYPEEFYNALAYFYVRHKVTDFYEKALTHRERCARVMEILGAGFIDEFPENGLAVNAVYIYSRTDLFNGEVPVLWSLVRSIAMMLRFFSRPLETLRADTSIRFLPGLHRREFWKCKDGAVAITWARPNINGSCGHYEVFRTDTASACVEKLCSITLFDSNMMSLSSPSTGPAQLGMYSWDGDTISFQWERPDDDPSGLGNSWTRLDLSRSQSLRMLDRSVSDEALSLAALAKEGFSDPIGYKVVDVIVSRHSVGLLLESGASYSVDISRAPFLRQLSPSDTVVVARRISDGRMFVFWPELMHCLPLEQFRREL